MKIRIIAADSLGVRSMATVVTCCSTKIAIDCSAALGPRRYGLPPHPLEVKALENALNKAVDAITEADFVIITHYHYDHYLRDYPYRDKNLLVKDPKHFINKSQRIRAKKFLEAVEAASVTFVDGLDLSGPLGIDVEFSEPLWHGEENTRLGYVIAVRVKDFIFASDVQGFFGGKGIEFVEEREPSVVYLSGFPTHFIGFKLSMAAFQKYLDAMQRIMEATRRAVIVDHHALRDRKFMRYHLPLKNIAEELGIKLMTASKFAGEEPKMLEAFRKELWKGAGLEQIIELSKKALLGKLPEGY